MPKAQTKQIVENCVVRILAYVQAVYDPEKVGVDRNSSCLGFTCDVTVEVESVINGRKFAAIVDHYGDGVLYETLDHARYQILTTTGVLPEVLPARENSVAAESGPAGVLVARTIQEFRPVEKALVDIEAESLIRAVGRTTSTVSPPATTIVQ